MPRTIEVVLCQYDELSDKAKAKARDWLREANDKYGDMAYQEHVFYDAEEIAERLGVTFNRQTPGDARSQPAIWYSGFSCQGDGACFEGRYAYAENAPARIRDHAPQDATLHAIADELDALQSMHGNKIAATVRHSGHYSHSGCTDIDVTFGDDEDEDAYSLEADKDVTRLLRAFMDWIYRELESAYEAEMEDDAIAETIRINEYEFEADGSRSRHG